MIVDENNEPFNFVLKGF